ncbi:dihydrodipicolinate synthase family protein [Rhodovulum sulfidophilum]|uniref:dihydrodipicolinate synthase family protein n=1 Tax=Rhodovulum sulfidophilum TaxID=35806 RepID=UPI0019140A20|nr:dihydrodipicolinate synthase family protein [Rhodovulum sulfidophilum]MBK5925589.1 dihydrodipicolinate synthase family protein [Rhodovulum sulfidophilum]
MAAHPHGGLYAATICPMRADGALDLDSLEAHFAAVLATEGLDGLLLNGHAGEGVFLSRDEAATVVRHAKAIAPAKRVLAAVSAEATAEAAADAQAARAAGADGIMVFAPFSWALGADPSAIVAHHKGIAEAAEGPIYLFQGSVGSGGLHYGPDTLAALLDIEAVVGIKEGSWETRAYEDTLRLTRTLRPDVAVMASGDEHLFACYQFGSDGSAVSLAAVVPGLIVALDAAVRAEDTDAALAIHRKLYPLAKAIYARPGHLAAARLKTCLARLGRIDSPACRAPTPRIDPAEADRLAAALAPCLEPRDD